MSIDFARKRAIIFPFTMIELMIALIVVAILVASAWFIYRPVLFARAYEAEIARSMSTLRTLQRVYRSEHGHYASDIGALLVGEEDFQDMRHVSLEEFRIEDYNMNAGTYTVRWEGAIDGYDYEAVTMNQLGTMQRIEAEQDPDG